MTFGVTVDDIETSHPHFRPLKKLSATHVITIVVTSLKVFMVTKRNNQVIAFTCLRNPSDFSLQQSDLYRHNLFVEN